MESEKVNSDMPINRMASQSQSKRCDMCFEEFEPISDGQTLCSECIKNTITDLIEIIDGGEPEDLKTRGAVKADIEEHMEWMKEL